MREYIISVITVSVIASVAAALCPNEKRTGKYVKYTAGLIILIVTAKPLLSSLVDFEPPALPPESEYNIDENADSYKKSVLSHALKIIEDDITLELYDIFHVHSDFSEVEVTANTDSYADIRLREIIITLQSYGTWASAESIKAYFEEKYSCEVNILYE